MINYIIRDCYSVIFIAVIIVFFMIVNKGFDRKVVHLFTTLILLAIMEAFCGSIERFMETQTVYNPVRVFLSWICYLTGPALLLTATEVLVRDTKARVRWLLAIPEFINIAITSLAFFTRLVFYYDDLNRFQVGPLAFVPRLMPLVYLAILAVVGIMNIRKKTREGIIILICDFFIVLNVVNELFDFVPANFRDMIISISIMAYFMYFASIYHTDSVKELSDSKTESEQKIEKEMIDQSIETLAYTIDAKDKYTRGHSFRVAKYSRMIAELAGKSNDECRKIYLAGLLHDIGKISISDSIINNPGKLSDEEYEKIKLHPERGARILAKMKSIPYIQDGAKYHHERYDGKGYPSGLSGESIPEIGRIIAVADAYDAMTSNRSYRGAMDQIDVRHELWKGMGTQFDPEFVKYMISLVDADIHFDNREKYDITDDILLDNQKFEIKWDAVPPKNIKSDLEIKSELYTDIDSENANYLATYVKLEDHWCNPTEPVYITSEDKETIINATTRDGGRFVWCAPVIMIYSSDDGELLGKNYDELGIFMAAGYSWRAGSAISETLKFVKTDKFRDWDNWLQRNKEGIEYSIRIRQDNSNVIINVSNELFSVDAMLVLPDNYNRKIYFSVTGDECEVRPA